MLRQVRALVDLGPLHGPLRALSWLAGTRDLERKVLQWTRRPHVRSRYGVKLTSNWSDATFKLCYFGSYGHTLSGLLKGQKDPFIFLDIGSNQGLYSLIAGQNPHCRGVIAFEPVPQTFSLLSRNVALNGLGARVQPVNKAIAAEKGTSVIRMNPEHSGGASMQTANAVSGQEIEIHTIDHDDLDELIPAGDIPIIVKIDVEGFEQIVVSELVKSRHVKRITEIFYEMDEQWADGEAVERLLKEAGFKSFRRIQTAPEHTHYDVLASR